MRIQFHLSLYEKRRNKEYILYLLDKVTQENFNGGIPSQKKILKWKKWDYSLKRS